MTQKNKLVNNRKKSSKLSIFLTILITIFAFSYTVVELINIYKKPENLLSQETTEISEKESVDSMFSQNVDFQSLRGKYNNNDIIARLEIPNVFNILLTQTDNNNFYLKYNIKKEKSSKGTEFIDYRNGLLNKQINIYGHNSAYYDSPFKKIELFSEKKFFDNNEYILLQHSNGRRIYKIVSFKIVSTDYEHMIVDAQNHHDHISKLLENSIYKKDIEYTDDTNLLILQTCTIGGGKNYYLLIAFEIE